MFRLTREVRFAINEVGPRAPSKWANGHGGYPSIRGLDRFYALRVTLEGELEEPSGYLRNIKEIDQAVREKGIDVLKDLVQCAARFDRAPAALYEVLRDAWPGAVLAEIGLQLSPYLSVSTNAKEYPMIRLSQRFEFCASHRLHNPALSDEENRRIFGKCNNPMGHGHNYELQVTVSGGGDSHGRVMDLNELEQIVGSAVISQFDHKNLNVEVAPFQTLNPTVENITKVIYDILRPLVSGAGATLASVTVWETPRTCCEYGV